MNRSKSFVTRLLSVVAALPAFFVDGVPAGAVAAAAGVAMALVSVGLVAPLLRRSALAGAAAS